MVNLHLNSLKLIKDAEYALSTLAIQMYKEREDYIEKLKGKKVIVRLRNGDNTEATFLEANLNNFKYSVKGSEKTYSAALSSLVKIVK